MNALNKIFSYANEWTSFLCSNLQKTPSNPLPESITQYFASSIDCEEREPTPLKTERISHCTLSPTFNEDIKAIQKKSGILRAAFHVTIVIKSAKYGFQISAKWKKIIKKLKMDALKLSWALSPHVKSRPHL